MSIRMIASALVFCSALSGGAVKADEFLPQFTELRIEATSEGQTPGDFTLNEDNYVVVEIQNQSGIGSLTGYTVSKCRDNDSLWDVFRAFARRQNQSAQLTLSIEDYDGNFIVENLPFMHITYTDVRDADDGNNCVSGLISGNVTPIYPVRRNGRFTLTLGLSRTDTVDVTLLSSLSDLAAGARDIFGVGGWAGKVLATEGSLSRLKELQRSFNRRFGSRIEAQETFPLESDDLGTIVRASLWARGSNGEIRGSLGTVDIRLSSQVSLFFSRDDPAIQRSSDVLDRPIFKEDETSVRAKLMNENTPLRVHASDIAVDLSDRNADVEMRDLCNSLRSTLRSQLKLSSRDSLLAMWSALEEMTVGTSYAAAPHAHDDACFSDTELSQLREHNAAWALAEPRDDFSRRDVGARMEGLERAIFSGRAADPDFLKTLGTDTPSAFFVRVSGEAFGESEDAFLTGDAAFEKAAEILGTRVARIGCYAPSELASLGAVAFHAAQGTDFSGVTANAVLFDDAGRIRGFDFATDTDRIKALHGFIDWPDRTAVRVPSCTRFRPTS